MDDVNNGVIILKNVIKPCRLYDFCTYGDLVEEYPLDGSSKYRCRDLGHNCPVYYLAENIIDGDIATEVEIELMNIEMDEALKEQFDDIKVSKPCKIIHFCPYGKNLVEKQPIDTDCEYNCQIFGHICPIYYFADIFGEDDIVTDEEMELMLKEMEDKFGKNKDTIDDQNIKKDPKNSTSWYNKDNTLSVIQALKDENSDIRKYAALTIGDFGDERALEPLIDALKDEDIDVRKYAVKSLVKIGKLRAVEALIETLKDENKDIRISAAIALGNIGDERAVEPLIVALNDEDSDIRIYAVRAMGNIGDERAVEPLIVALNDEDSDIRISAAIALGNIGDERAVEPLIEALNDESYVKKYAADALGNIGDERAVEPLIEALNDEFTIVKEYSERALGKLGDKRAVPFFHPESVIKFITSYFKDKPVNRILDPCVNIGSMIIPLTKNLNPKNSIGFVQDKNLLNVINKLKKDLEITWEFDDFTTNLNENSKFDLIIGFPPWSLKKEILRINSDNNDIISIFHHKELLLLIKSLNHLTDEGTGFFILSKGFLSKNKKIMRTLEKLGIYIDSILEIPNGSFPHSSIPGELIIFKKEIPPNIFSGEINSKTYSSLLNNLKLRKNGKIPQLGILQDLKYYKSLDDLVSESEINKIAKKSGFDQVPLSDILIEANLGRSEKHFDELPNSVYLPTIGTSDAVTSFEQFKIKPQNYIQLVLDPEKANADFVAGLYNAKFGKKIRNLLFTGAIIPKITKSSILNSDFYIVDIDTQNKILHTDNMLKEIYSQLNSYQNELWKFPKSNKVQKSIELLNVGRKFDYWTQTLPYPLSSILSACKSDGEIEHRIQYLLDFFEALSMFNAIVILSSITSNTEFYEKHFLNCFDTENEKNWLYRTSFTNWNISGFCLAKRVRQIMQSNERKLCLKLFGNPNRDYMDLITSTDFYHILNEVEDYRNLWKGHGARVNRDEYEHRFNILRENLNKIRQKMAFIYDDVSLILPYNMEYDGETYKGTCKEIKGFIPFDDIEIETIHPLIKDNLYIIHENQYEAVKLIPFIRIMPGPRTEKNACYFYNRYDLTENKARFLSYHFEDEAEVNLIDKNLKSIIALLKPENISNM